MRPDLAHLTARAHPNVLSLPVRHLVNRRWPGQDYNKETARSAKILDYGCGHGDDVDLLRQMDFDVDGYDPHFFPDRERAVRIRRYDVVLCTYVFNTIPYREWRLLLQAKLYDRLRKHNGVAYITVRCGVKPAGWRKDGTWQGNIQMPLPIALAGHGFVTYAMRTRDFPFPPFTR
jgi:hypothetical protein